MIQYRVETKRAMATYCYRDPYDGQIYELDFPFGHAPESTELSDGTDVFRWYSAEHAPRRAGAGWPMECLASGVSAEQAGELRELFRREGIPTEVTKAGNPIYTSPEHRRRALKVRGFCDQSSYC